MMSLTHNLKYAKMLYNNFHLSHLNVNKILLINGDIQSHTDSVRKVSSHFQCYLILIQVLVRVPLTHLDWHLASSTKLTNYTCSQTNY